MEAKIWVGMIQFALHPKLYKTQTETIHSSCDLKPRNTQMVKRFFQNLTTALESSTDATILFNVFKFCAVDVNCTIDIPFKTCQGTFYGREGLFHHLVCLQVVANVEQFHVQQIVASVKLNVYQVQGDICFHDQRTDVKHRCTWKSQVTLSSSGKLQSLVMFYDLFELELDDDVDPHYSRSKRILSLSVDDFKVYCVLGKGAFGTVIMAEYRMTKEKYAIKILNKEPMTKYDQDRTRTEMRILRDIHHPFIAHLEFSFQTEAKLFLGMKFYPGGSLYHHLHDRKTQARIRFSLPKVRFYAAQILLAISHLHSCDIVYRDLKPDNIMINTDGYIVLVDFGLSKVEVKTRTGARTMAGSPGYTAPELLQPRASRKYGKTVDWWTFGILLYEMVYATRPFSHSNISVLYRLIEKEQVKFPHVDADSYHIQDLIKGLLTKDPMERLGNDGATSIMNHPFFQDVRWDDYLEKRVVPFWRPKSKDQRELRPAACDLADLEPKKWWNPSFWTKPVSSTETKLFDRFSYVEDGRDSFLIDEKELLESALQGKKSSQLMSFTSPSVA